MALQGTGALAMWWDIAPGMRAEFEDWHSREHFPERMSIPGFRRGTRWMSATGDDAVFVLYEVASHDTLSSPPYAAHLNAPTPWSTKMMPHHRNMVRSQCHVVDSRGGAIARHALTVRCDPARHRDGEVATCFASWTKDVASRPGLTGAHRLRHEATGLAPTTEQRIRSAMDGAAACVFVACGYDLGALRVLESAVQERGTGFPLATGAITGLYSLSCSATPGDFP